MSKARIRRLGVPDLRLLPPTCPTCPLGVGQQPGRDHAPIGAATWARAAEADWGFCGVGIADQDRLIAYLLLSPPLHIPRVGPQSGFGLNPDAAVVMSVRVVAEYAGVGLGRQLVQAAAGLIARTPFHALETRGAPGQGSCAIPPVGFLEAVGFTTIDAHPVHPRLRLELSRTVSWLPDFRPALDRVIEWVRPLPPEPAGLAQPQRRRGLGSPS